MKQEGFIWSAMRCDGADQTVSTGQKYRHTGKPFDDEGAFDLYYYGARYYDPRLGRFISIDPASSIYPGLSPYVYAGNNPLKYFDLDGDWYIHVFYKTIAAEDGTLKLIPQYSIGWNSLKHEILKAMPYWGIYESRKEDIFPTTGLLSPMASGFQWVTGSVGLSTYAELFGAAGAALNALSVLMTFETYLHGGIDDPRLIQKFEELFGRDAVFNSEQEAIDAIYHTYDELNKWRNEMEWHINPDPDPTPGPDYDRRYENTYQTTGWDAEHRNCP